MPISAFLAKQRARPSGLFGRLILARMLNGANQRGNDLIYRSMAVSATDRVLEVGFGGGELMFRLAHSGARVDGLELSRPMLDRVRRKVHKQRLDDRMHLHEGSVEFLPFADGSFDSACSVNTIYFWPDLQGGFRELARVLRPQGRLVLGFGADTAMRLAGYDKRGFALYSPRETQVALSAAGLTPIGLERLEQSRGAFFALTSRKDSPGEVV